MRCVVSLELSDGHFLLVHGRFLVWEVDFWTAQERSGLALFWFGGLHTLLGQKVAGQDFHSSPWVAILLKLQHGLALQILIWFKKSDKKIRSSQFSLYVGGSG